MAARTGVPSTWIASSGAAAAGAEPKHKIAPSTAVNVAQRYFMKIFPQQISDNASAQSQPKEAY
jgi:hypothetical protein